MGQSRASRGLRTPFSGEPAGSQRHVLGTVPGSSNTDQCLGVTNVTVSHIRFPKSGEQLWAKGGKGNRVQLTGTKGDAVGPAARGAQPAGPVGTHGPSHPAWPGQRSRQRPPGRTQGRRFSPRRGGRLQLRLCSRGTQGHPESVPSPARPSSLSAPSVSSRLVFSLPACWREPGRGSDEER